MSQGVPILLEHLFVLKETPTKRANTSTRRQWNQAFFKAIYVADRTISRIELKEPFGYLMPKGSSKDCHVGPAAK